MAWECAQEVVQQSPSFFSDTNLLRLLCSGNGRGSTRYFRKCPDIKHVCIRYTRLRSHRHHEAFHEVHLHCQVSLPWVLALHGEGVLVKASRTCMWQAGGHKLHWGRREGFCDVASAFMDHKGFSFCVDFVILPCIHV